MHFKIKKAYNNNTLNKVVFLTMGIINIHYSFSLNNEIYLYIGILNILYYITMEIYTRKDSLKVRYISYGILTATVNIILFDLNSLLLFIIGNIILYMIMYFR